MAAQSQYWFLIFLFDEGDEFGYFEFELVYSGVDDVERIVGIIVGVHLKFHEACGYQLIHDGWGLMVLEDERVGSDGG